MPLNRHLISIIIPCYNDADFIEQAVNSALNQTYSNTEIIIVDDGSDNRTKKVLKSIQPKIDQLIVQDNQGQSNARNNGIRAAQGEYIVVLDSDDYFEPAFAERALKKISENEEIKVVTCWGRRVKEDRKELSVFKPNGGSISNFIDDNAAIGNSMFRKSDWERAGGYDESMRNGFEDWEFYIRLMELGGEAYVIPEVLFNYRVRKSSTTIKANKIKYDLIRGIIRKNIKIYEKYHLCHSYYLLQRIEREEKEKYKLINSLEYQLGNLVLRPFRLIKKLFW